MLASLDNLTEKEKSEAIEKLITQSTPRQDFFVMTVLSVLMATLGLLLNSSAVIIGSMLIAPILYPILSLALGITMADRKLMGRSFLTILKSFVFGIAASLTATLLLTSNSELTPEIIDRTEPSLLYAAVAITAGLAASFALIKPNLSESFPGIAISAALIPPIAVSGIGFAKLDWEIIRNSFVLFLINILGIIFTSLIVFSLMNLYIKKKVVYETIKKEDKALKKELKK